MRQASPDAASVAGHACRHGQGDHRARYQAKFGRVDAYAIAARAPGRRELRRIDAMTRAR